jgi:hypothetical protein
LGPNQGCRIHQWGGPDDDESVLWFGGGSIIVAELEQYLLFELDLNLGIRFRNMNFEIKNLIALKPASIAAGMGMTTQ